MAYKTLRERGRMVCTVCNVETHNIELDTIYDGGVPIETPLCLDCVALMKSDRMNEIWSFQER